MSFYAPWTHLYGYSLNLGVLIPVLLSGWLYWRGRRISHWAAKPAARRARFWRGVAFYVGLGVVLFALESPIDYLSNSLFWIHMVQHCLLQVVAALLIVVGAPWTSMWRGLPLSWRRAVAPGALAFFQRPGVAAVRHFFRYPATCLAALALTFWVWHVPYVFDIALQNNFLHDVEHLTLLASGLLYWSQTVDSAPLKRRLGTWPLAGYLVAGTAAMWVVAVSLGLSGHAWYAPYYNLASRPGGISALTDQQWGAGVAWVPAALPFEIMLDVAVLQWLQDDERRADDAVAVYRAQQASAVEGSPTPES
ncbi:MAG TPA: cytochrome c oxidase assembly protein [Candidatus Dormibacteraeota bacterium]|nr:cytochrome c oxidase assembly protein [Candidatus Dormibacteraeota bacterium]